MLRPLYMSRVGNYYYLNIEVALTIFSTDHKLASVITCIYPEVAAAIIINITIIKIYYKLAPRQESIHMAA